MQPLQDTQQFQFEEFDANALWIAVTVGLFHQRHIAPPIDAVFETKSQDIMLAGVPVK
jgi:hypothetical protein